MLKDDALISNIADAERVGQACEALLWVLSDDPRVERAYEQFCLTRERALDALEHLVHRQLKLPYDWLPSVLLTHFAAIALHGLTGAVVRLQIEPGEEMKQLPPGRRPKAAGQSLRRDVEWYYRVEIKAPPDSIRAIARAYASAADASCRSKDTDSRSVVQNGIKRAKLLLAAPSLPAI